MTRDSLQDTLSLVICWTTTLSGQCLPTRQHTARVALSASSKTRESQTHWFTWCHGFCICDSERLKRMCLGGQYLRGPVTEDHMMWGKGDERDCRS
ncbi:hypothetical protein BJX64DRAFT_67044 [Aspergillus heterothallicus]